MTHFNVSTIKSINFNAKIRANIKTKLNLMPN